METVMITCPHCKRHFADFPSKAYECPLCERVFGALDTLPKHTTIEVDLPNGQVSDEAYKRAIQAAIPLGGRYISHTTRTISRYVADVVVEMPS